MPKLCQELVVVVTAHDVVRHRDPNRRGGLDRRVGPVSSFSNRARITGMIHESWLMTTSGSMSTSRTPGVRMLVFDDETQCRIELLGAPQACGRPADAVVEHLAFVNTERVEQFALAANQR